MTRPRRGAPRGPSWGLPYPWGVLGHWPMGGLVGLAGPPGSGKSSLAALLQPTMWITSEQTAAQAAGTLRRCLPADAEELPIVHLAESVGELDRALDHVDEGLVVLDSVTAIGGHVDQVDAVDLLDEWVDEVGRWALVIQGVTQDDKPAGRRTIEHTVDAYASIHAADDGLRTLGIRKNRAGPLGSSYFVLGDSGVTKPDFPYAYSVEGPAGRYRLVPYPSARARWAGLLALHEEAGTLCGGLCAASRPVRGYPNGLLQPADVAQRKAFAHNHGLTWVDRLPESS